MVSIGTLFSDFMQLVGLNHYTKTQSDNQYAAKDHSHTGYLTSHQDISGKIDTAGTGLSKTGTTLNHSNSITAQTTSALKKIKYDAQGHITGVDNVAKNDITALGIPSENTVYTHPSYTPKNNGLYKITVDNTGHISSANSVSKNDITALGIPSSDTTYNPASSSSNGLMSSNDKTKLDNLPTRSELNNLIDASFSLEKITDFTTDDLEYIHGDVSGASFAAMCADANIDIELVPNVIYLVENDGHDESSFYNEYVFLEDDGTCEMLGTTSPNIDWSMITNRPSTYSPSTHTHTTSDLSDFPTYRTTYSSTRPIQVVMKTVENGSLMMNPLLTGNIYNSRTYDNIKSGESSSISLTNQLLINNAIDTKFGEIDGSLTNIPYTNINFSTGEGVDVVNFDNSSLEVSFADSIINNVGTGITTYNGSEIVTKDDLQEIYTINSDYRNRNTGETATITLNLFDFNENNIVGKSISLKCDKGSFANGSQTYTATTDSTGKIQTTWTAGDGGITKFYTNDRLIGDNCYIHVTEKTSWTEVTYASGYARYSSGNGVYYRKIGNTIELDGYWATSSQRSATDTDTKFASIPSSVAPSKAVRVRCPGSGVNTYLLTIETNGDLKWARYGASSSIALPATAWCTVHAVWTIE